MTSCILVSLLRYAVVPRPLAKWTVCLSLTLAIEISKIEARHCADWLAGSVRIHRWISAAALLVLDHRLVDSGQNDRHPIHTRSCLEAQTQCERYGSRPPGSRLSFPASPRRSIIIQITTDDICCGCCGGWGASSAIYTVIRRQLPAGHVRPTAVVINAPRRSLRPPATRNMYSTRAYRHLQQFSRYDRRPRIETRNNLETDRYSGHLMHQDEQTQTNLRLS